MLVGIFESIQSVITNFTETVVSGFENVGSLFYTYSAQDGLNLTFLGTIAVISVGAGLVWLVYRLIKGAIRGIGR